MEALNVVENCEYTLRPVRVGSKKTEVGIRKKKGIQCPFHSIDCQRISCNCTIEYEFHEKEAIVTQVGRHCHKRIHNLCNYGRINPEVVRQFHEYDAEKHEICSEYCFNDWYVNYTLPLNDIVSRTLKF